VTQKKREEGRGVCGFDFGLKGGETGRRAASSYLVGEVREAIPEKKGGKARNKLWLCHPYHQRKERGPRAALRLAAEPRGETICGGKKRGGEKEISLISDEGGGERMPSAFAERKPQLKGYLMLARKIT